MSSAVHLLKLAHDDIRALLDAIEESEGVITEEQENQLQWLLHNEELALSDMAKHVKELEERAERLRQTRMEWNKIASNSIHGWEERAGKYRAFVRDAMVNWKERNSKSTLRSPDEAISVTLRANKKGTLEIDDPALDKEQSVRGFTEEQIRASSLPMLCFKPLQTVYRLDRDELRRLMQEEGAEVATAKITNDPTLQIKLAQ